MSTRGAHSCVRSTPTGLPDWTSIVSSSAERGQGAHHGVERAPVAGGAAGAAVDDEVVGPLGDLGVEVVLQHAQRGLGLPGPGGQGGAARCADGACALHVSLSLPGWLTGQRRVPVTVSAAASAAPVVTNVWAASISGPRWRSGPGPATCARSPATTAAVAGGGRQRRAQVEGAGGGEQLDREHAAQPVDGPAQLARRRPAHRHVVLLHRRGRDRVDRGGHGEPLELGDDRRPACTGRSCGRSRRRGRRRGTAAARPSGPRRGSGRCAARRSTPGRRRRSRGSPARSRAGRRGSCRCSRPVRRAARPGCRWPRPARAPRRSRRARACRAPRRAPAASSAASRRPAPGCTPGCGGFP